MKIKTLFVFLALIGSLSCTIVYGMIHEEENDSDEWLIDRLKRLEEGFWQRGLSAGRYLSYRRPKDDQIVRFESRLISSATIIDDTISIVRKSVGSLEEKEILNFTTKFYNIFMIMGFSFSPDFSRIISHYLSGSAGHQNMIMVYNRLKPSSPFSLEKEWNQGHIPIACCSNSGEVIAWIGKNQFTNHKYAIYFHDNSWGSFNPLGYSNLNFPLEDSNPAIKSMSFNYPGTKVGVRTDKHIMIIDVIAEKHEPRYYPLEVTE